MKILSNACVLINLSLIITVNCINVQFNILSTAYLPYTYSPSPQYELGRDAAEQLAFDVESALIYSVGHTNIHVIDVSNVAKPEVLLHQSYDSVDITDVEVCGGHVFIAFDNQTARENGFVDVFRVFNKTSKSLELVNHIIVGDIPDMIQPVKNCSKVLVAIEAEPYVDTVNARLIDNAGGVGIITFTDTPAGTYNYKILDFNKFNSIYDELEKTGVRWVFRGNNNSFSNDIEPEYIAINSDESKAYICLQENNAIAVVDLAKEEILDIYGLGFKDWAKYTLDVSDKDGGIHMRSWPIYGMYQPDSIKLFTFHGIEYIIMANEGDTKDYPPYFSEVESVRNIDLSDVFESNDTTKQQLKMNEQLGRLQITTEFGKNTTTGKYDKLYSFGGRSFSIMLADTMERVYDSRDELEHRTALLQPSLFNSGYRPEEKVSSSMDTSSYDKGPAPESVTIAHFGPVTLLMIGIERPGTIAVYSIDERLPSITPTFETLISGIRRTDDTWDNLYNAREISMLDPEDLRFIPGEKSPNEKPLLIVSGSTSGTVSILQVTVNGLYQTLPEEGSNDAKLCSLSKDLLVFYLGVLLWR